MSFRCTLWLAWLACAAACGGSLSDESLTAAGDLPGPGMPTAELEVEGAVPLSVVARGAVQLRVRFVDLVSGEPLAFKDVQFALSGNAEGASLQFATVLTDANGYATNQLTAGGTVSSFQVRASAGSANPVYFDVQVVQAARPALTLRVSYQGQRTFESYRITVINNMTCEQVRNASAEAVRVSYLLRPKDDGLAYPEMLGAGSPYVAFAWASDSTNSTLATGCSEFLTPVRDQSDEATIEVTVPLRDIEFSLAESYDVSLALDLSRPLASLAMRTSTLVKGVLPATSSGEASYLLDRLATRFDFTAARQSQGLDAKLAALLTQGQSGPLHFFEALSNSVSEESMDSTLEGRLTPARDDAASRFEVTRLVSMRGGKSARDVDLAALSGAAELRATYSDAQAALNIEALKVPLGFGRFAAGLLDLVQTLPDARGVPLSARFGCVELAYLVSEQPAAFPGLAPQQVASYCAEDLQALLTKVRADWASLDDARDALQLRGLIYVHDRDGDAEVDDLGPSPMSGSWMSGNGSETSVSATLRVTPKSALTI